MKKMRITLSGETAEIMERLCTLTGLTPPNLVALLLRKSSKELESWVNSSAAPLSLRHQPSPAPTPAPPPSPPSPPPPAVSYPETPLELPSDKGDDLKPIEL